ncbi:glycosyltransferase family 39 protein [Coxiella burnetii]|uniref:glycosyltransferase family 39 protein n=1 Tax=Coxiella burnetii TaxID=777 RepID=UPI002175C4E8|nr:glycosyltransferase family 39 protein [Coxiella burnetii]
MNKLYQQRWILPAIVIVALVLKLSLFFIFYHGDVHQITQPDSEGYLAPAKSLIMNGNYGNILSRTPGYPTFIAILFVLFGQHLSAIIITQIILSSLLIIQGYYLAHRLFSPVAAYISAILIAINFLFLSYTLMVLTDLLFAIAIGFVFLIGSYLFSDHPRKLWLSFSLGLALATATLIRPVSYYLLIPLSVGALWYFVHHHFGWRKPIISLILLTLPSIIFIGGWQVRNQLLFGTYAYTSITANNLYWYYMGNIIQKQQHIPFDELKQQLMTKLQKQGSLSSAQENDFMTRTAVAFLFQHPKALMKQMLKGFSHLMISSDHSWVLFFDPHIDLATFNQAKRDLLHHHFSQSFAQNSLSQLLLIVTAIPMRFFLFLTYLLIALGIVMLPKTDMKKNRVSHLFLLGCVLYFILVSSSSISYARFRSPFELILLIYASFGLSGLLLWLKQQRVKLVFPSSIKSLDGN